MTEPEPNNPRARILVPRHRLVVRITHWINVISLLIMLFSGLNIFNAHPALYWGQASTFSSPWLSMKSVEGRGVTTLGGMKFDTTGVFGVSRVDGMMAAQGFPAWSTLPAKRDLAAARNWHLFFAWLFGLNGLVYIVTGLVNRHLQRDLIPTMDDLKNVPNDIVDHAKLKFHKGWAATRYGPLQKIAYAGTALVVLPVIVLTGMTMSPGLNAAFPFLLDIFGGRQSARSIHFIGAMLVVAFIFVHLVMVLLTGPLNQVRGMITGKFAIIDDKAEEPEHEPA